MPRSIACSIAAPPCGSRTPKRDRPSWCSAAPPLFSSEFPHARQISLDAGVSVSAIRQPARATWRPRSARAPGGGSFARRHRRGDHRFWNSAARRSAAEPHSRVQGFRGRQHRAGGQLRPRHPRRGHRGRQRPQLQRAVCGHRARRRHRGAASARRRLLRQHQRRDRRARMDRPQSRDLSHQGGEPVARPRGARVDLHGSAGPGRGAFVAQGRRGGDRRGKQGHQCRDRSSRLRRRRRALQRAVVDLRRLSRYAGLAGI